MSYDIRVLNFLRNRDDSGIYKRVLFETFKTFFEKYGISYGLFLQSNCSGMLLGLKNVSFFNFTKNVLHFYCYLEPISTYEPL